jgi:hypothetical protein
METARFPKTNKASDHRGAGKFHLAGLQDNRFIQRQVVISMIFADKDSELNSLCWYFHSCGVHGQVLRSPATGSRGFGSPAQMIAERNENSAGRALCARQYVSEPCVDPTIALHSYAGVISSPETSGCPHKRGRQTPLPVQTISEAAKNESESRNQNLEKAQLRDIRPKRIARPLAVNTDADIFLGARWKKI